jgi:hypothetical protein
MDRDAGEAMCEHALPPLVPLNELDRVKAGSVEAQRMASDAGEKIENSHRPPAGTRRISFGLLPSCRIS